MAALVVERELTDIYFYAGLFVVLLTLFILRGKIFPYHLNCAGCERKLDIKTIYFIDSNLCADCRSREEADVDEYEKP